MTDKLRRQKARGDQAKRLLENPLFIEAFDTLETTVLEGWKNSDAQDQEGRHNAYLMWRLLQNLRHQFKLAAATGRVAEKELLELKG